MPLSSLGALARHQRALPSPKKRRRAITNAEKDQKSTVLFDKAHNNHQESDRPLKTDVEAVEVILSDQALEDKCNDSRILCPKIYSNRPHDDQSRRISQDSIFEHVRSQFLNEIYMLDDIGQEFRLPINKSWFKIQKFKISCVLGLNISVLLRQTAHLSEDQTQRLSQSQMR